MPHNIAREACVRVLSDEEYGFNVQLAEALLRLGVSETVAIDWGSGGVAFAQFGSNGFQLSRLGGRLTLEIAPSGTAYTGASMGVKWSGEVGVRLIFHLRFSLESDEDPPDDDSTLTMIAAAIERAVIESCRRKTPPIVWQSGDEKSRLGGLGRGPDCPEGYQYSDDHLGVLIPMAITLTLDLLF